MNGRLLLSRYWLLVPLILVAIVVRNWTERAETFEIEETVDMRRSEADYYLEDFTTRRFDENGALEYLVSGRTLSHFPDDDRSEVEAPRVELRREGAIWRVSAERGRLDTDPDVFTLIGDVQLERTVGDGVRTGARAPGESAGGAPSVDPPSADADADADELAEAGEATGDVAGSVAPSAGTAPGEASPPGRADAVDAVDALAGRSLTIRTSDLSIGLDSDEVSTDEAFEIVADTWRLDGVGLRSSIDAGKLVLLSDVNGTYDAAVSE